MVLLASPSYVIIWCPRSVISLAGIVLTFVGLWRMDRKWDDLAHSGLVENSDAAPGDGQTDYKAADAENPTPTQNEGVIAFAVADAVLVAGFVVWAVSFFFSPSGNGYELHPTVSGVLSSVLLCAIAYLLSKPFQFATTKRDLERKQTVTLAMTSCWILFMILQVLSSSTRKSPLFPIFGVSLVVVSYYALWQHRRMGKTWDLHGTSNSDYVVQSYGTCGLVIGLFLLWISSNALRVPNSYDQIYLPIYCDERAMVAVLAIYFIILPMTLARDYAFDRGSKVDGYGLDGSTFSRITQPIVIGEVLGAVIEGPVFHVLGWTLLGVSALLPVFHGITLRQCFTLLTCIGIAVLDTGFLHPSFWNADAGRFETMTNVWYMTLSVLALSIGVHGGIALALSVVAVVLIAGGRKYGMEERRKGEAWVKDRTDNAECQVTVFGIGIPMYTLGMIALCLAMSIPMN